MMRKPEGVAPGQTNSILMTLQELASSHDVIAIYLHGSRAQGTALCNSDADVAVLLGKSMDDWDQRERLAEDLATVLAPQLSVPAAQVEIHFLNSAPPGVPVSGHS